MLMKTGNMMDARGDRLFQSIMTSPEYYLTDCELEIFETRGDELARALMTDRSCELIELGSGDGLKTSLLLDAVQITALNCSNSGWFRAGPGWISRRYMPTTWIC
jgi:uncharacterized SAM-dependent methyltransferase